MLIKLLKHEFLFYFRKLPPLYLAMLLIALVLRFKADTPDLYMMLLYFSWRIMIVVITLITLFLIIQRFVDNFLKEPGALMLTLPVTVWELIASKAIAALGMIFLGVITGSVSTLIINPDTNDLLANLVPGLRSPGFNGGYSVLYFIFYSSMIIQELCLIYTAIIITHLLPRFRFVAGCAIFFIVNNFIEQPVFNFVTPKSAVYEGMRVTAPALTALQISALGITALIFAALFFWSAGFLFKRTFNLE